MNLFKKKTATIAPPLGSVATTENIEQQIYKDVYSAQRLLLDEANKILNENFDYDSERITRLQKMQSLGFVKAPEVCEFSALIERRKKQEKLKELIVYLQQSYPLNNFISEGAVKAVCEKYGLLLCSVYNYIAEIPEKNQKEIVNFKIKNKDIRDYGRSRHFIHKGTTQEQYDMLCKEIKDHENDMVDATDLLIIAPENKIDMTDMKKVGHMVLTKDPIVLQPVQFGYLIVSSWGLEASDELVVNPKAN